MKQVKILFLCLIGFLSTLYSVNAQQNAGITSVGSATACPGTLIIPVNLSVVTSISGFSLDLYYDATVLSAYQSGNNSTFILNANSVTLPLTTWGYAQTTKSAGVKQIKMGWNSSNALQLDTDVNGVAHLFDVKFRYMGGSTTITWDNSSQSGGNCEYTDSLGNPMIDVPTSSFYINGTVTQGPAPSQPSAITGSATPCQGSYIYSVTNDPSVTNYTWTNTGGYTGTSTTDAITYTISGTSTPGEITVMGSNACGSSPVTSIEITSIAVPSTVATSASASLSPVCPGASTTLTVTGGSLGDGANWYWYSGSCGGTLEGSTASLVVTPTSTTTYYVDAEGLCNTTTCVQTTVTSNSTSTAATSVDATVNPICPGSSSTLSITGGSLGTNGTWQWYTGGCGITSAGSGLTMTISPTVTTDYYVRAEGNCNTTTCVDLNITINSASVAASTVTAINDTVCNGSSTTLTANGGTLGTTATWQWYTGSCGGTSAGNGMTLNVTPAVTTDYFVRAEGACNTTTCVDLSVVVNDLSVAVTSANASALAVCPGSSSILTITGGSLGTGATWQWYIASCGGTSAGSGTSLSVTPTVTTDYYVRAEGVCNTTTCQMVTVTLNDSSFAAATATALVNPVCAGAPTVLGLTGGSLGTGATWQWYSVSCGGTSEGAGATLTLLPSVSTTYYVRAEGTCNTTTCANITVTVSTNSVAASSVSAAPDTVCAGSATTLSITGGSLGTGAVWSWYSGLCGGTFEGNGSTLTAMPIGTIAYYVRAEGTCFTTACVNIIVNVNDTSIAAGSANATPPALCAGTPSNLTALGGTLGYNANWNWYSGSCGTTFEGSGSPLTVTPTVTTTYYVRAEGACNTTPCVNVMINVNTLSVAATSATTTSNPLCSGSSATLGLTGGSLGTGAMWTWYTGICGGASGANGSTIIVTPTITTIYYVRAEGLCNTTTCVSMQIDVIDIPVLTGTIAFADTTPCNNVFDMFSVTNISGATYTWSVGSAFTGSSTTSSITYFTNTFISTIISVTASNACGTSNVLSIAVINCVIAGVPVNDQPDFGVSNYPNPFNNLTTIEFTLPQSGLVTIDIYNVLGEHIMNVANSFFDEGKHQVSFDGTQLPVGVYPYKVRVSLNSKTYTKTKMMNIIK